MENYTDNRLQRVLALLFANRRKINKQKSKIETLQTKIQKEQEKLDKLQAREEKLRDSYDFYYGSWYKSNEDDKLKTTNAHNKHIYDNQFKTNEQKTHVCLPEAFNEM